jgi:hypothetical protein
MTPGGREVEVVVPDGVHSGDEFQVTVPPYADTACFYLPEGVAAGQTLYLMANDGREVEHDVDEDDIESGMVTAFVGLLPDVQDMEKRDYDHGHEQVTGQEEEQVTGQEEEVQVVGEGDREGTEIPVHHFSVSVQSGGPHLLVVAADLDEDSGARDTCAFDLPGDVTSGQTLYLTAHDGREVEHDVDADDVESGMVTAFVGRLDEEDEQMHEQEQATEEEEGPLSTMIVDVPDGCGAGDVIIIETPDGAEIEVEIPEGYYEGDEFEVDYYPA